MASGSLRELTASFSRNEGVNVCFRNTAAAGAGLPRIAGAQRVTERGGGFLVEWAPGRDLRDDITRLAVEMDWGLLEMKPVAMDIEDLYLRIVSGEAES